MAVAAVMSVLAGILGILAPRQAIILGIGAILVGMYPIAKSNSNMNKLLGGAGVILGVLAIVFLFLRTAI